MSAPKKKTVNMTRFAVIQIVVMLLVTMFMVYIVSNSTNKTVINNVLSFSSEKSRTIESHVESAEQILSSYSCADEILNLLSDPKNEEYTRTAQEYTERVSGTIKNLEGIYVSEWNTHVLAHTNKSVVNITTRNGEKLKELQAALLNTENGVYNAGIIVSPASGDQIISIYKAVYDKSGNPAGIVGLGIYTTGIVSELGKLGMDNLPGSFYSVIDAESRKYIFHSDDKKVNTETDIEEFNEICKSLKGKESDKTGTFNFRENGQGYVSVYNYVADRGWIVMICDKHAELYSLTFKMIGFLVVFIVFYIIIAIFFSVMNKKNIEVVSKLESTVQKNIKTKESLSTAVYNDILTDTRNRISFTKDFEGGKVKDSPNFPYYFAMFNICGFSNINITYGEDAGDAVLSAVADTLRASFDGGVLYRTGSDEFVAVVQEQANKTGINRVNGFVSNALNSLSAPVNTPAGSVSFATRASIVKKGSSVDYSVLAALKDVINQSSSAVPGQVGFMDLDNL